MIGEAALVALTHRLLGSRSWEAVRRSSPKRQKSTRPKVPEKFVGTKGSSKVPLAFWEVCLRIGIFTSTSVDCIC
jgi:hypothetical protein